MASTAEACRLDEAAQRTKHWRRWGPCVSERAWGSVRENYSQGGNVDGLEGYRELFDRLQNPNGAIKIFCEVAPS
jgi:hypothetical protein